MLCRSSILLLLASFALATGCRVCETRSASCAPCATTPGFPCRPTTRRLFALELSTLASPADRAWNYCEVTDREAACWAAARSSTAKLLLDEIETKAGIHRRREETADLIRRVLRLQALHERNRAAGGALVLVYRLAEAEAAVDNLAKRQDVLKAMAADIERLKKAEIDPPVSADEIAAGLMELENKRRGLDATIETINHQLAKLLSLEPTRDRRLWPAVDLSVDATIPDPDQAYGQSLTMRGDLAAVRVAAEEAGVDELPIIRSLLASLSAGLGSASSTNPFASLLNPGGQQMEANVRQEQLRSTAVEQARTLRHDVMEAIVVLEARTAQVVATRDRLAARRAIRRRWEKQKEDGAKAVFGAHEEDLAIAGIEQDLVHDVVEQILARVKLLELQGALAFGCGYCEPITPPQAATDCP